MVVEYALRLLWPVPSEIRARLSCLKSRGCMDGMPTREARMLEAISLTMIGQTTAGIHIPSLYLYMLST